MLLLEVDIGQEDPDFHKTETWTFAYLLVNYTEAPC